jgi:translation elongation factor EF-1alpha
MAAQNAKSFEEKLDQLEKPKEPEATPAEVHITSNEVIAAFAQSAGAIPAAAGQITPNTDIGSMPAILDQQVSFDGDQVHGQFLTTIAGKNVWITVSGHLGSKDGYATFEPTEFKLGDMSIPVSLVNEALQKKMAEQHEQLKLPNSVGGMKIENGELVLTQK